MVPRASFIFLPTVYADTASLKIPKENFVGGYDRREVVGGTLTVRRIPVEIRQRTTAVLVNFD